MSGSEVDKRGLGIFGRRRRSEVGSRLVGESIAIRMFVFGVVAMMLTGGATLFEFGIGWHLTQDVFVYGLTISDTLSFGFGFAICTILMGAYVQWRNYLYRKVEQERLEDLRQKSGMRP